MDDLLALSALQHYAYCPRQFALIHIEQGWEENRYTAEGQLLHQRVDSGASESRRDMRYERGVAVESVVWRIQGKMDLLEIVTGDPPQYFPVEYKRGKPKVEPWDRIQLCAQALCIEEMRQTEVDEGAIWYWEVRRREPVTIDADLRRQTIAAIEGARQLLTEGKTPPPTEHKARCRACSLKQLCQPETFRKDWSAEYLEQLGQ